MRFVSSLILYLALAALGSASDQPRNPASAAKAARPSIQQLVEFTPPDGSPGGSFGQSVAIAGDTIAIESFNSAAGQGAVYVYVKPATGWKDATLTAELTAVGTGKFGWMASPVTISPDGNTILVNGVFSNAAYPVVLVYEKPTGGWVNMNQTAALNAKGGGVFDFGRSIATDGDSVLVGGLGCSGDGDFSSGAAYLFVQPASGWTDMSETALLKETDPIPCDDYGVSVAIQGDTAVVGRTGGGMTPPVAPGAVYVFTKPIGGWTTMGQTAKLMGQTNSLIDGLGYAVALSGDTILAPLTLPNSQTTASYIYSKPSGGWVNAIQTATLTNTNKGVTRIGDGIAVDGSTAAIIAEYRGGSTRALTLYDEPSGGWKNSSTPSVTVIPSDEASGDFFGLGAVAISGNVIVVGSSGATRDGNQHQGTAYIFQQN